jgi:hypothetical protein
MPRRNLSSCWIRMKRSGCPSLRHSSALRRARFLTEIWACRVVAPRHCNSGSITGTAHSLAKRAFSRRRFMREIGPPTRPAASSIEHLPRLFDIFRGPHFTLLAFGVCSVATVDAVNQHYDSLVHALSALRADEPVGDVPVSAGLRDTHGHAQRAYDPTDGMLILIRPDGYVGLIANGDSPSSVQAYLGYLGAWRFSPPQTSSTLRWPLTQDTTYGCGIIGQ